MPPKNTKKNKRSLNIPDKVMLAVNVIAAVLLLLSYLAPYVSPRQFSFIAILGFCYQIFFLVNLLFVIGWLFRIRVFSLISGLAILIGLNVLLDNFGFRMPSDIGIKPASAIRIMQYNVHEMGGIDKLQDKPILDSICKLITIKQPDIIDMEEFYFRKNDSVKVIDSIKDAFKSTGFYMKDFSKKNPWFATGIVIFSKFPIIDTGSVQTVNMLGTKAIYADVKYKSKILRIYAVHLAAVQMLETEKRKYLSGKINLKASGFIESKLNAAFMIRSYQAEKIKRHMEDCPYPYIVTGDFNDTPISYSVNEIGDGMKNTFTEKGSGMGTTYYSTFPKLHIDYIFASQQFDVLNYQTVQRKWSDHKPIFSDLKLN